MCIYVTCAHVHMSLKIIPHIYIAFYEHCCSFSPGTGNLGSECEVQCMNPKNKLPVAVSRAGSSPNVLSN